MKRKVRKNILFVSLSAGGVFFEDDLPIGGAEVQVYLVSSAFAKYTDGKINVLTNSLNGKNKTINYNYNIYGFLRTDLNKIIKMIYNITKIVFFLFDGRPNIAIIRANRNYASIIAWIAYILGIKFVFSVALDINYDRSDRNRFLFKKMLKYFPLIVQNKNQYNDIKKFRERKYISIIPNMVNAKKNNLNGEYILWIGRFTHQKNPKLLLKAVKRFKEYRFLIIISSISSEYEYILTKLQTFSNVDVQYKVKYQNMSLIWSNAKMLILTSYAEGISNVILESWGYGKPVVSYSVDINGFLNKGMGGYVANKDEEKFMKYIEDIHNNEKTISFDKVEMFLKNKMPKHLIKKWVEFIENI